MTGVRPTNASHALGSTFVDELARGGVRHACLAPGSRSAPLALAFAADERIRVHVSLDERSASFMALGIARATGRPVPVLTTSGTAAANLHPAVVEAHQGRVPLIVLTADRPPELRDTGANQTIDQVKLFGDAVRWFVEVGVPEELPTSNAYWRSLVARAIATASGSPAGPVHLNVAFREPLVPGEGGWRYDTAGRDCGNPWTAFRRGVRTLDDDELRSFVTSLEGVEHGIVFAGAGPFAEVPAAEAAAALGWPLLADPLSGLRTDPSVVARYDAILRSERFVTAHPPEVVLRFGSLGISKSLMRYIGRAERNVLVDGDGSWRDPDRTTNEIVAADVSWLLGALPVHTEERTKSGWLEDWARAEAAARRSMDDALDAETGATSEPRIARDLVRALPDGAAVVVAASMPFRDLEWYSDPRTGLTWHGNRGANGIDGFVSTAAGIAVGHDGPTFALCGDLSFLHDQNGLLDLAGRDLDLTLVVVNNDGGGIFSFLPQAGHPQFEQLFGTPHGLQLSRLAELHSIPHHPVEDVDALGEVLRSPATGPRLLEVRTDRTINVVLHRRLNEAAIDAIDAEMTG